MDMLTTELTPRAELTLRELNRVREARERLLADIQNPPDLAELARSVGMTPKRLNFGFRQLFGDTAFHYLLEVRMKTAKRMLDDGFEQPLKQVAWLVGYSQVSNFVTAFRRRFGVSPGIYRRSESDAE
jgi:AraC-like DNA-binding protein